MAKYTMELLERTIRFCQPYSQAPLSEEAAAEILDNLTTLFLYLRELETKYGREENV